MNKEIQKGDRIFARLSMGRRVILEFMINRVGSMAELMAELREMTGSLRGLGRLQVRNQSRGWAEVHDLMFYGQEDAGAFKVFGAIDADITRASAHSAGSRTMLFPWETH